MFGKTSLFLVAIFRWLLFLGWFFRIFSLLAFLLLGGIRAGLRTGPPIILQIITRVGSLGLSPLSSTILGGSVLPGTRISGVTTVLPGTRILLAVAVPTGSAVRLVAVVAAAAGGAVARVGAVRGAIVVPPAGATVIPLAGTTVIPLAGAGVLLGSVPAGAVVAGVLACAALAGVPTGAVLTAAGVLARSLTVGGLVAPVRVRGGAFSCPHHWLVSSCSRRCRRVWGHWGPCPRCPWRPGPPRRR